MDLNVTTDHVDTQGVGAVSLAATLGQPRRNLDAQDNDNEGVIGL